MIRRWSVLCLLVLAGCAGRSLEYAPRAAEEGGQGYVEAEPRDADSARDDERSLASDPYSERAGGDATESAPVELAFAPPPRDARLASARPRLPARGLSVAFVTVRDGQLVAAGRALLDFERAVQSQPALDLVADLRLGEHDAGADLTADLRELAAVAAAAGRDLLVVEARDADDTGEVYVVHAASGELILRVRRGAEPPGSAVDLIDALAFAAAGLDDEG